MLHPSLKLLLLLIWLGLLGLLIRREFLIPSLDHREDTLLAEARETSWYGVWLRDQRIGYVRESLERRDGGLQLQQKAELRLKVLGELQPVSMNLEANLDTFSRLRDFRFWFISPFYRMQADGKMTDGLLQYRLDTGQTAINDTLTLPEAPILPVNQRGYLLRQLSNSGQRARLPQFDPLSLTSKEAVIEYHGREKLLILHRVHHLHRFSSEFSGIRIDFWLNDQGKVIKEVSPAGFVFLAEPEFKARDVEAGKTDLLTEAAVPLPGPPPPPDATVVRYRLSLPDIPLPDLEGGRQNLDNDVLTIIRETSTATGSMPCQNTAYRESSRHVQAEHPQIVSLARDITNQEKDAVGKMRLLADWVHHNLEKRPVLGLPDALSTLRSRRGDCNEHAALFAALARAAGLPTVIATGVTLQRQAFYYHAWNEVCLDGSWFSLDTTLNQLPADLTHIRLVRGDMEQQLVIGSLLGKLAITLVPDSGQPQP